MATRLVEIEQFNLNTSLLAARALPLDVLDQTIVIQLADSAVDVSLSAAMGVPLDHPPGSDLYVDSPQDVVELVMTQAVPLSIPPESGRRFVLGQVEEQ